MPLHKNASQIEGVFVGEVTDGSDLSLRARPFKYFETKLPASLIAFTMLLKEFSPESEIEPPIIQLHPVISSRYDSTGSLVLT